MKPEPTDPAGIWQAWVEQGVGDAERYRRFGEVPVELKARVASHMKGVKALEERHGRERAARGRR